MYNFQLSIHIHIKRGTNHIREEYASATYEHENNIDLYTNSNTHIHRSHSLCFFIIRFDIVKTKGIFRLELKIEKFIN